MTTSRRVSLWLAGALLCANFWPVFAAQTDGRQVAGIDGNWSGRMSVLVARLDDWLDRESHYPPRARPASIRFINAADVERIGGQPSLSGLTTRAIYDASNATIFLVRPWSSDNVQDVSFLLHELAHHRQQSARHWYCQGAQELPAYRLQEKWLAERGSSVRISWLAALLQSGCSRRDFHPR